MKQITLSIEQMKHLEELGLDTSDASHFYGDCFDGNEQLVFVTPNCDDLGWEELKENGGYTAYSLQDVLFHLKEDYRKMVMFYKPEEWLDIAYNKLVYQLTHKE